MLGLLPDSERVRALAEVGVVFLLFEIGLELPLDRLRRLWRSAVSWASSVGIASASSVHESAIDWTPPSAAASAWYAARTTLFSGRAAWSVTPPV